MTWLMTWRVACSQRIKLPLCQIFFVVVIGMVRFNYSFNSVARYLRGYREPEELVTERCVFWSPTVFLWGYPLPPGSFGQIRLPKQDTEWGHCKVVSALDLYHKVLTAKQLEVVSGQ